MRVAAASETGSAGTTSSGLSLRARSRSDAHDRSSAFGGPPYPAGRAEQSGLFSRVSKGREGASRETARTCHTAWRRGLSQELGSPGPPSLFSAAETGCEIQVPSAFLPGPWASPREPRAWTPAAEYHRREAPRGTPSSAGGCFGGSLGTARGLSRSRARGNASLPQPGWRGPPRTKGTFERCQ